MKKLSISLIALAFAAALVLSAQSAMAEDITGSASVDVLVPIGLLDPSGASTTSMDFGKVLTNSSATINASTGALTGAISGAGGAAGVNITGDPNETVGVVVTAGICSGVGATNSLSTTQSATSVTLDAIGTGSMGVGGTITTGAISGPDSCSFTVSVNY
jgi:hypothetical protein